MTGLEISLLVVGVVFFIGSFFFVEKLSSSDIETIQNMSEREIRILLEKQLDSASGKIDRTLESKFNETINRFDRTTERRTTEEIFSISEHADSIIQSIDEKVSQMQEEFKTIDSAHTEIVFLHNMLSDKQKSVSELEKEAKVLESNLRNMKKSVEEAIERLYKEQNIRVETVMEPEPPIVLQEPENDPVVPVVKEVVWPRIEVETMPKEDLSQGLTDSSDLPVPGIVSEPMEQKIEREHVGSINDKILAMHREGFSDVDIARSLGKGVGEIRLVLGVFEDEE